VETSEEDLTTSRLDGLKRWLLKKLLQFGALAVVLGGVYISLSSQEKYAVYVNFFEHSNPKIRVTSLPAGVGSAPAKLVLEVEDNGTGLDEVIVRTDQDGEIRDILQKRYPQPKFSDRLVIELSGKNLDLSEGNVDVLVSVFDRSFWSNGRKEEIPLKVDYDKPKVEVLSAQHNAIIGGTELCFYRVTHSQGGVSGVRVGNIEFRGYPARLLDTAFEAVPDVYFSYFAIPLQFKADVDQVRVFARNAVGNESLAPFYYKAQTARGNRRFREVEPLFIETKLRELSDRLQEVQEQNDEAVAEEQNPAKRFQEVVDQLRIYSERKLKGILSLEEQRSYWENVFERPRGQTLRVDFSDVRDYILNGAALGTVGYTGAEHASIQRQSITPVAPGKVRFAGYLPFSGKTVVIDHGFGISTLYGALDSIGIQEEADVTPASEIGKAGSSGLSDAPGLYYELRVHGVPVRPVEFWDARWVKDHIRRKIDDMKRSLNLVSESSKGTDVQELTTDRGEAPDDRDSGAE